MDRSLDSTNQLGEVLGSAEHLEDALWRVESAGIDPTPASAFVVAGMGGSAIGARLAFAAIGDRATAPLALASNYALPPWLRDDAMVLCSSYSGGTEETLACYDAAAERGLRRVVASTGGPLVERARRDGVPVIPVPGGFQPRAAVGYATIIALEVARLAGAAGDLREEVKAAAAGVAGDAARTDHGLELAGRLHDTVPVIYGAELSAPLAYRWKCQFNENAKQAAFSSELPEADHNEICGWAGASGQTPVFLADAGLHPRNAERLRITAQLAGGAIVVPSPDGDRLTRLMRGVLHGDLVSIHAALLRGVDPVEIAAIDRLKSELA